MSKLHVLKTDPAAFSAVFHDTKKHEIRFNDRDYQVGDVLELHETVYTGEEMAGGKPLDYTGRTAVRTVSHVQTGYGLADGWCILSFSQYSALTPGERAVIENLLGLAVATYHACDNTEERVMSAGESEHVIQGSDFDAMSEALDVLGELPDDKPGYTLAEPGKARWALRRIMGDAL